MPALFVNLKIDQEEKLDFFKVTFSELIELFDEYHIKIRGNYTSECLRIPWCLYRCPSAPKNG